MAEGSLRTIINFFNPDPDVRALSGDLEGQHRTMDAKAMIKEWKPQSDKSKSLTDEDKRQLREGIESGTLTY